MNDKILAILICSGAMLIFVGIGFIIKAVTRKMQEKFNNLERECTVLTQAVVVKLVQKQLNRDDSFYYWFPTYQYNAGGEMVEVESINGQGKKLFEEGQNVDLYYSPDNLRLYYVPEEKADAVIQDLQKVSKLFIAAGIFIPLIICLFLVCFSL